MTFWHSPRLLAREVDDLIPKAALALWFALVGGVTADVAAGTGVDFAGLQRIALACGVPVVASWLLLTQFPGVPIQPDVRTTIKATHLAALPLAAGLLLSPETLRGAALALVLALCIAPVMVGTVLVHRAATSASVRWYAAGLVAATAAAACAAVDGAQPLRHDQTVVTLLLAGSVCWLIGFARAAIDRHAHRAAVHDRTLEAARKYRHVYYSVPIGLLSLDANGHVIRRNDFAERVFADRLAPGRLNALSGLLGEQAARTLLDDVARSGRHRSELERAVDGDPRTYSVEAVRSEADIEVSLSDMTAHSRLAATLEHAASHDFLTDCLNRRGLEHAIDALLPTFGKTAATTLIYIDLDRFKAVNDVFGHAAGDAIVIEVARRLQALAGAGHLVGRVGGDEFVVVMPGVGLDHATRQAEQMLSAIVRETVDFEGAQLAIEASLGVIEAAAGMQTRDLMAYADEACAHAKRSGRGRVTALRPSDELLVNFHAEKRLGKQLRFRLPTERLRVFAQPIVPLLGDLEPMSYEVLLRVEDDRGGIDPPSRLIAAAERQGAMASIDRFMLESTIEHLAAHPAFLDQLGFVAVNLSGMSLNDGHFVADIAAMLRQDRRIAGKICLEITESVALFDVSSTRQFVDEMRSIGAMVALDDFGAGYTSFAYLKELPANLLKIDGQFITGLSRGSRDQGIVRAIHQVGRELGMKCLAEWVEDEATARCLTDLQIDYAQGFHFSRPMPIATWSAPATLKNQAPRHPVHSL